MSNSRDVKITFEGERGAGKSLMMRALANFLSTVNIPFVGTEDGDEHTIVAVLDDEHRNMLADFIVMRESQRRN